MDNFNSDLIKIRSVRASLGLPPGRFPVKLPSIPAKPSSRAFPDRQARFVVAGVSSVYKGKHLLNINSGFHPAKGSFGRLSQKRIRQSIRLFDTRDAAQAWADENNAAENRLWTTSVETLK